MSANACVFAAFLMGAATGALICWRISDSKLPAEKPPFFLRLYGRLELLAAISGLAVCLLLNANSEEFVASLLGVVSNIDWLCNLLRFLIAFLVLLIPCACMGASYAALGKAFAKVDSKHLFFPMLYGVNTIGAAAGSICTSFAALPALGLTQTAALAAGIDALIFIVCELLSAKRYKVPEAEKEEALPELTKNAPETKQSSASSLWASCAFVSGFLALVLEITWSRIFSSLFGSSVYSVGAVLFMVLLGAGGGSIAMHFAAREEKSAGTLVSGLFIFSALSIIAGAYCHEYIQFILINADEALSKAKIYDAFLRSILTRQLLAAIIVLPSSALLGAILPAAASATQPGQSAYGARFYALNCLGGVSACIIYGAFFFRVLVNKTGAPLLISLLLCALICSMMSIFVLLHQRKAFTETGAQTPRKRAIARYAWLSACAASLLAPGLALLRIPHWNAKMLSSGWALYTPQKSSSKEALFAIEMYEPVFFMEGLNSTISVSKFLYNNNISLKSDAKVEATLPIEPSLICPGSDLSTHVLLAGLPLLFHRGNAEKGLLIGLGSGSSASALLSFSELKKLKVVEIEPAVRIACKSLQQYNGGLLDTSETNSQRVDFDDNDARFALSSSKNTYDIIVSQPGDPWAAASADLFTREFFALAKSRLNNNGTFCQWLQIYAIPSEQLCSQIATFCAEFPCAYICHPAGAGELLLLGFKDDSSESLRKINSSYLAEIDKRLSGSWTSNEFSARAGLSDCFDPLSMILLGADELPLFLRRHPARINTDDEAKLEFATCKSFLESNYILERNFFFLSGELDAGLSFQPRFVDDEQNNQCRLSRAFARQSLQDGSLFRLLNEHRANEIAERVCKKKIAASTVYNRALIMKAFQKDAEADSFLQQAKELPANDQADSLAIFDLNFGADELQKCVQILPTLEQTNPETVFRAGLLALRQGQPGRAIELLRNIKNKPRFYLPCILSSAYASAAVQNFNEAENFFAAYLSINPWDYKSQLAYTSILCRNKKLSQAARHASDCLRLRPNDTDAMVLICAGALSSGNYKLATEIQKWLKHHVKHNSTAMNAISSDTGQRNGKLQFLNFAHLVREKAEDPNNGYKILGEP